MVLQLQQKEWAGSSSSLCQQARLRLARCPGVLLLQPRRAKLKMVVWFLLLF